jgi:molybdopterin-containing oxidoreductase family membrane subunit
MNGVLAISVQEERLVDALTQLRARGFAQFEAFSPMPGGKLLDACLAARNEGPSRVRWFTLVGALCGLLGSLALTYGGSLAWPLITGGKPITTFTAFSVIVFECTILLAGLATVGGFLLNAGLFRSAVPGTISPARYSERFLVDTFGLFVPCGSEQVDEVIRAMRACGLEEISVETA